MIISVDGAEAEMLQKLQIQNPEVSPRYFDPTPGPPVFDSRERETERFDLTLTITQYWTRSMAGTLSSLVIYMNI